MTLDIVLPSGAEKKLSRRHVRQLAKFTDPSSLLISLLKAGWNMDEQISAIVKISQNSDKPIQQLNAIKYLNSMITEAMERSGLLVSATHKITDPSGEDSMVFSGKVVSSVLQDHDDHLKDKETQNDQEAEEIKEDQENQEEDHTPGSNDVIPAGILDSGGPVHSEDIGRGERDNIGGTSVSAKGAGESGVTDFDNFGRTKEPVGDAARRRKHFAGISGVQSTSG